MINLTNMGAGEGGAFHQISLAREFRRLGIEVRLIAPRRRQFEPLPADFGEMCCLSPSVESLGLPVSIDSFLQVPHLLWARLGRNYRYLYVRYNLFSILLACLGRLLGMKVVVEHNSWGAGERMSRGGSWLLGRMESISQVGIARLSHHSRCVSSGLADLLANRGVPQRKLCVIGNGTDLNAFHPMEKSEACNILNFNSGFRHIGFLGLLTPWQGCETAIRAMAHLDSHTNVKLVIGGEGPERRKLEMLAKEIGVGDTVQFLGYVSRKHANCLINCFDIAIAPFTHTRNSETGLSPIKIRDYAAAGRPIAASAVPGISELTGGGWLFVHKPEDPKELALLLERMLSPDFDLVAAGQAARKYAEQNFDWGMIAKQVASLF